MEESREPGAVLDARLDQRLVERVVSAAENASPEDRVRAGVEAVVEAAELDPEGTSEALAVLRGDPIALQGLEAGLGLPEGKAILALGAAIQLSRSELSLPEPDLRGRLSELLRWLEGGW